MRIVIDARAVFWTGIGTYIRNLLQELAWLKTPHTFAVLAPDQLLERFAAEVALPDGCEVIPVESEYYSWREQIVFGRQLRGVQADLFHFTHFNVPYFFRRPYVVTIHDTTRFIFPGQKHQHLLTQIAYEALFARTVRDARHIICVTKATRDELCSLPIRAAHQPQVVYEGVAERFFDRVADLHRQKVRAMLGSGNPYLLYVGVWMSHKNLRRALEAFRLVRDGFPELKFVICGKPVPGYTNLVTSVREMNLEDSVIFPGFVPHELLPALYAESRAFCFTSLYEGFGLPPLEAAAVGTPVIASNVSSVPEVMGEAACYVNPESVSDIAGGMRRVLGDAVYRKTLATAGLAQARRFSWKTCAGETLAVYQQALKLN